MICPDCHRGMVQVKVLSEMWEKGFKNFPCPRCNGSCIAYCCDGEDASYDADTLYDGNGTIGETEPLIA